MTERAYNPVTAIDESSATGEAAKIFADIRATMQIPLVTSIWRGLHDIESSLPAAWAQTKPLYGSGLPSHCLHAALNEACLARPDDADKTDWVAVAGGPDELSAALAVVKAYNRSNGLNLVALSALLVDPTAHRPETRVEAPVSWPVLRTLKARDEIPEDTWQWVLAANALGTAAVSDQVATLWRHLAHWPALLQVIHRLLEPLHHSGELCAHATRLMACSQRQAQDLAHWRLAPLNLPPIAAATVRDYVGKPGHVARMVAIGHLVASVMNQRPEV